MPLLWLARSLVCPSIRPSVRPPFTRWSLTSMVAVIAIVVVVVVVIVIGDGKTSERTNERASSSEQIASATPALPLESCYSFQSALIRVLNTVSTLLPVGRWRIEAAAMTAARSKGPIAANGDAKEPTGGQSADAHSYAYVVIPAPRPPHLTE